MTLYRKLNVYKRGKTAKACKKDYARWPPLFGIIFYLGAPSWPNGTPTEIQPITIKNITEVLP